jgi:hypothetical protein
VSTLAVALYAWEVPSNPPGFYIDESSIAYNAYSIAQSGEDEHGEAWPLYFRAFGDYKNPIFIYLLAAVFKLTGPSIAVARGLSAELGAVAALLLGLLAFRLTGNLLTGVIIAGSALLTPWLYEASRLVFEVSVYPLVCVLFLLALRRASSRAKWTVSDVILLGCGLALLTYSYSIGRLLAPLLAAGLAFFISRRNLPRVLLTWAAYAVTLIPLLLYSLRHPGALLERFGSITYISRYSSSGGVIIGFLVHYLADMDPSRWLITGEDNIRDHLPGSPALLAVTLLLALVGAILVLHRHRFEPWWRFQIFALAVSAVPAALTVNDFPQLRLIAFPVFLHVLTAPAIDWLRQGHVTRLVLYPLVVGVLAQGTYFQWRFHQVPPERWYVFDARFPGKVLAPALDASADGPIYLYDLPGHSGYIQALWHGAVQGVEPSRFVRLAFDEKGPPGGVVISTSEDCSNCRILVRAISFMVYAIEPAPLSRHPKLLDAAAFHAVLVTNRSLETFPLGRSQTFEVITRNMGTETWPAVGDADSRYAVSLHAQWRHVDQAPIDGEPKRVRIPYDMEPGDTAGIEIEMNPPKVAGTYLIEVTMVQDGTATTSEPLRLKVNVKPDADQRQD